MRTTTISSTTIEYPDVISFCFNPVVMNIYGKSWAYVEVTVIDVTSGTWHKEKRAMFGSACFFDLSFYMQSAFDATEFGKIDYSQSGAQDSQLGRLFSVSVDLYSTASSIGDSFQFVRNGYFCIDSKDSTPENLVFNRIVSLKSSFKLPK